MARPYEGGIAAPKGFLACGVSCGIKATDSPDLAVVYSERPAVCAGMFTRNAVKAAPVHFSKHVTELGRARAIVVNSGVANACTGELGNLDTVKMARLTAMALNARFKPKKEIVADEVVVSSTGKIGEALPMDKVENGIRMAVDGLDTTGGESAARAIMTTDTVLKQRSIAVTLSTGAVHIGGMAKGSGMIAPDMATMLAFLTTDAVVDAVHLRRLLRAAVIPSFNSLTIDGQMSTNDTIVMLANGASGMEILPQSEDEMLFAAALNKLCLDLACDLARDGEGATKLLKVTVSGAMEKELAYHFARAVAESALVKTAMYGRDANWGRIISAMGAATGEGSQDVSRATIKLNGVIAASNGQPYDYDEAEMERALSRDEVDILIELPLGGYSWTVLSCDLTEEYVRINAEYRT